MLAVAAVDPMPAQAVLVEMAVAVHLRQEQPQEL
jgi:hypothetical protein